MSAACLCSILAAGARAEDVPTFTQTTMNPSGTFIKQAYGGDVDNDGFDDLILVMGNTPTKLTILRGNPANPGTFQSPWEVEVPGAGFGIGGVLVTDVNRDGIGDTVVSGTGGLSVYLGNAPGSANPLQPAIVSAGIGIGRIQLAGVNSDAWPDLSCGGGLMANMGATQPGSFTFVVSWPAGGIAWGDFDGDGWTDAVAYFDTTVANYDLAIWRNDQSNSFQYVERHLRGSGPFGLIFGMTSADMNGDGRADLAYTARGEFPGLYVMLARPTPAPAKLFPPRCIGGMPNLTAISIADFNLDGLPDILSTGGVPKVDNVNVGTCLEIALNSPPPLTGVTFRQMPLGELFFNQVIATGDWNGDGKPDIAACNSSDATRLLTVFWNTTPASPASCPADLNSDTMVDDADFVIFVKAYNELLCE